MAGSSDAPRRFTEHALRRMQLRNVSAQMALETIPRPSSTGRGYSGKSLSYRAYPSQGVLKVVFREEKDEIVVITVMWD